MKIFFHGELEFCNFNLIVEATTIAYCELHFPSKVPF